MSEDILNQFKKVSEVNVAVDVNKKVKVGIIGTGWIADAHIEAYKTLKLLPVRIWFRGKQKHFSKSMALRACVAITAIKSF